MKTKHAVFIQRCLDLAVRGKGLVAPNPMVGAVLVHENKIIAEGWHQQYGGPHAEVNCLNNLPENKRHLLEKSTIYVNLEPCSHFGKTPPCADLIVQNKIHNLVYANKDPNPLVAGKGLAKIKAAKLGVSGPVLEKEAAQLNKRFFTFQQKKRPYIILKWAQTSDGFINKTDGEQNWITGESAKMLSQQWRFEEAAILVGKNTVQIDNPQLTNRLYPGGNHPLRIVIDPNAELDFSKYKMGKDGNPVLVFNTEIAKKEAAVEWIKLAAKDFILQLLEELFARNIQSLIVEGGAFTLQQFIDENLWDEARIFTASKKFESGLEAPKLKGNVLEHFSLDSDQLDIYYPL